MALAVTLSLILSVISRGTVCHTITYHLHHQPWHCHTITYPLHHQPWHWLSYYRLPSPSSAVTLSVTLSLTLSVNSHGTVCHTITYPLRHQQWHWLSHYHLPSPSTAVTLSHYHLSSLSTAVTPSVTPSLTFSIISYGTVCRIILALLRTFADTHFQSPFDELVHDLLANVQADGACHFHKHAVRLLGDLNTTEKPNPHTLWQTSIQHSSNAVLEMHSSSFSSMGEARQNQKVWEHFSEPPHCLLKWLSSSFSLFLQGLLLYCSCFLLYV